MYTVLFTRTGLSPAEISSLFAVWSLTAFAAELPSGVWADTFSRRRLIVAGPLVTAAGFTLWIVTPSYPAFAAGFVLWGLGQALISGALEALVYEELERAGAAASYARVLGRATAVRTTAVMVASALAGPVLTAGGYPALGVASVATLLVAAAIGRSFPESGARGRDRRAVADGETAVAAYLRVLRTGLAEVRTTAPVRRALAYAAVLMGLNALDEYLPLLALATGVAEPAVPLLVLLFTTGDAVGGWLAGRGERWEALALAVAAACLAAGSLLGTPAAMVLVAAAFGVFRWAITAAEARLQARVGDEARATVASMTGFASEIAALAVFGSYALGSAWADPGPLFAAAAVPYLLLALARRFGRS
ncbi:putative MFS family arabinose efflux permease [Thermopolyspora flexuosa]|uniref:Putative MFS family arabinose efflux permease n=1 Tax=Thermopolyspora flexuosa TaxID=103836 RepID=A0A543IXQ9_9ACTN|nr:putative MFS family arabinose efflux permease [Thermopolyspora flexuosa]